MIETKTDSQTLNTNGGGGEGAGRFLKLRLGNAGEIGAVNSF